MWIYFAAAAGLTTAALLWTAWTGIGGDTSQHLPAGLVGSVVAVATHSLVILFMIITGRVLREAMLARPLGPEFLVELNDFFAQKKAYPVALLAVFATVTAAVLGYGNRGFNLSPAVHMLAGVGALVFNLWALPIEYRTLRANQGLIDRAAKELDRIDREAGEVEEEPIVPASPLRVGLTLAIGPWLPYTYWGLIVWKGRFESIPLLPFLAVSLFGIGILVVSATSRRAE
jgi:hypothetical protein